MKALLQRARAESRNWGQRLNAIAALLLAYLATDSGALSRAIDPFVPDEYKPLAGALIGLISFAIVNAASRSDAKRVLDGAAGDPR